MKTVITVGGALVTIDTNLAQLKHDEALIYLKDLTAEISRRAIQIQHSKRDPNLRRPIDMEDEKPH